MLVFETARASDFATESGLWQDAHTIGGAKRRWVSFPRCYERSLLQTFEESARTIHGLRLMADAKNDIACSDRMLPSSSSREEGKP